VRHGVDCGGLSLLTCRQSRLKLAGHRELRALLYVRVEKQHHPSRLLNEGVMVTADPPVRQLLLEGFASQIRDREVERAEALAVEMKDHDLFGLQVRARDLRALTPLLRDLIQVRPIAAQLRQL